MDDSSPCLWHPCPSRRPEAGALSAVLKNFEELAFDYYVKLDLQTMITILTYIRAETIPQRTAVC